jgi:hypothetical protein
MYVQRNIVARSRHHCCPCILTTQVVVNNNVVNIATVTMEAQQCALCITALGVSLPKT